MSHVLVFWTAENKYSVVKVKNVLFDKTVVLNVSELVGNQYPVLWKKRQFNGEVKSVGTHTEMKEQEAFWEQVAAEASFTTKDVSEVTGNELNIAADDDRVVTIIELVQNEVSNILDVSVDDDNAASSIDELREQLRERDLALAKEKAKNKRLRRLIKTTIPVGNSEDQVEIGAGVCISVSFDVYLKASFTSNPSVFLHRLVFESGIFDLHEVASCSLTGKRTIQSPVMNRPPLDPAKFKVVKDYTIKCCDLKTNTVEMLQFEMKIRSICTDARKKLKSQENASVSEVN